MRIFTKEELAKYDGRDGISYVACDGQVYDVSRSLLWQKGRHQAAHRAGRDLTEALKGAPHGSEMLKGFPLVGRLLNPHQPRYTSPV